MAGHFLDCACIDNTILLGRGREGVLVICGGVDGPGACCAEWSVRDGCHVESKNKVKTETLLGTENSYHLGNLEDEEGDLTEREGGTSSGTH